MRVVVDQMLCESNALCVGITPAVFDLGEDDRLTVLKEHPEEELRNSLRAAAFSCPKQAITILDD